MHQPPTCWVSGFCPRKIDTICIKIESEPKLHAETHPLLTFGVANNSRAANDHVRPIPDLGRCKIARVGDGVDEKYDFRIGLQHRVHNTQRYLAAGPALQAERALTIT
jgi:hypothetical protein